MKTIFVFDATPLIYLSKAKILEKIAFPDAENIIIAPVYEEVVLKGMKIGKEDAFLIQKSIEKGIFKIEKKEEQLPFLKENKKLSDTDKDIVSYCAKKRNAIIITDDEELRKVADIEDLPNHGSIYILFRLLILKRITKEEFKTILSTMIGHGWYCSIDLFMEIMSELEKS